MRRAAPKWVAYRDGRWWLVVRVKGRYELRDGRDRFGCWASFEALKLEAQFNRWKLEREVPLNL